MKFNNGLTTINYTANAGFGILFPAKTILINSKELIVISPGDLDENTLTCIRKITPTPIFIAPNNYHHLYISKMFKEFPQASFFGPKRAMVQSGVDLNPIDKIDSEIGIVTIKIPGNKVISETCFYHPESEILIITDLFMNMHHDMNLPTKIMFTLAGTYHKLNMSRLVKSSITDKKVFYSSIRSLLDFPFKTVILGHGNSIDRSEFEELIIQLPDC